MNNYLELGQIVNVKGLKGEVKINSYAEDSKVFEKLDTITLRLRGKSQEVHIEKVGYNQNQVIIKFKEYNSVEEAEQLRNSVVLVDKADLGELPEGVYYWADLIGLDVYTDNDEFLGKVDDIYSTGANDIYVVKNELGMQRLLPGISEVIKEIKLNENKIIVHLMEGL